MSTTPQEYDRDLARLERLEEQLHAAATLEAMAAHRYSHKA